MPLSGNTEMWVSVLAIGLAAAAAGSGTFAYFSDTETSQDNLISAGTLDLTTDGDDTAATTLSVSNQAPGDSFSGATTLANEGSLDGELDVDALNLENREGENPEPETDTSSPGDLGANAEIAIYLDADQDGTFDGSDVQLNATGSTCSASDAGCDLSQSLVNDFDGTTWDAATTIASGDSVDFVIEGDIPSDVGNEIQGDELDIDFEFTLEQPAAD